MQISSNLNAFFVKEFLKTKEASLNEQERLNLSAQKEIKLESSAQISEQTKFENSAQNANEQTKSENLPQKASEQTNQAQNSQESGSSQDDGSMSVLYKRLQQIYQQIEKLQAELETQDDISARNSILAEILQLNGEAQEINNQIQKALQELLKSLQKSD